MPGCDVELTIDRDIQWAAQNAITEQVAAVQGATAATSSCRTPATGQVLAMANAPGFDPNDLAQANPAALGNPALQDAFEPGCVTKLMSMAAVLNEGVATPRTHVVVPNRLQRGDRVFHDDIDHGTEDLTLNGRARQVQQHRHHPGDRPARQAPSRRPTRSSTRTCGSSASASRPGSTSPARRRASCAPPGKW